MGLVRIDLEYRLRAGESACVEAYLKHFPELAGDVVAVRGLLAGEFHLRREIGVPGSLSEYEHRFPEYRHQLTDWLRPEPAASTPPPQPAGKRVLDPRLVIIPSPPLFEPGGG